MEESKTGQARGLSAAIKGLREGDRALLSAWLRRHLFDQVLPFWEKYALDEKGGLQTCLTDDGSLISGDKWLWSQWRAVWVFSRIYNKIDRNERWLRHAKDIAGFCTRVGWDGTERSWYLAVDRDGAVLRGCESTYVDAFAVYGLAELCRAERNPEVEQLARQTAEAALKVLERPYDQIPHFPYPIPKGAKPHGIPMLWSLAFAELGDVLGEPRYLEKSLRLTEEIMRDFYRQDRDLFLEFVALDGSEFPRPAGTAVVPGHVIEDMWFQIHNARLVGKAPYQDYDYIRLMMRHLEFGWDRGVHEGLLLAVDAEGRRPVGWNFSDTKLWWPHTEALYGTLLAWKLTGDKGCLDWYERVWSLCLERFVDWEHGEWRQRLGRDLKPIHEVVALPVKDPFHLPRSLILQIEALQ